MVRPSSFEFARDDPLEQVRRQDRALAADGREQVAPAGLHEDSL